MAVLIWVVQGVAFLAVWKAAHLLFWNARRMMPFRSLPAAMAVTAAIAAASVAVVHAARGDWATALAVAALLGVATGEYEYNRR